MGVELGKVLAKNILAQLDKPADVTGHDSSVSFCNLNTCRLPADVILLLKIRLLGLFTIIKRTERSEKNRVLYFLYFELESCQVFFSEKFEMFVR